MKAEGGRQEAEGKPGLAILQNMWVRDPEKLKATIARAEAREAGQGEEVRRRAMTWALFAGCLTGQRLKKAFGEELIQKIVWEESTREIAGDPRAGFAPDYQHIETIIRKYQPKVVLAFGRIAATACVKVMQKITFEQNSVRHAIKLITVPHPAARQPDTMKRLIDAAYEFWREVS